MHRFVVALLLIFTCWQMPAHSLGQDFSVKTEAAEAGEADYDESGVSAEHDEGGSPMQMYLEAIFYQLMGGLPLIFIWMVTAVFGLYLCTQRRAAAGGCLTVGALIHLFFFPLQVLGECYIFYFDESEFNSELLAGLYNMALSLFFVTAWVLVLCSVALMRKPLPADRATGVDS